MPLSCDIVKCQLYRIARTVDSAKLTSEVPERIVVPDQLLFDTAESDAAELNSEVLGRIATDQLLFDIARSDQLLCDIARPTLAKVVGSRPILAIVAGFKSIKNQEAGHLL